MIITEYFPISTQMSNPEKKAEEAFIYQKAAVAAKEGFNDLKVGQTHFRWVIGAFLASAIAGAGYIYRSIPLVVLGAVSIVVCLIRAAVLWSRSEEKKREVEDLLVQNAEELVEKMYTKMHETKQQFAPFWDDENDKVREDIEGLITVEQTDKLLQLVESFRFIHGWDELRETLKDHTPSSYLRNKKMYQVREKLLAMDLPLQDVLRKINQCYESIVVAIEKTEAGDPSANDYKGAVRIVLGHLIQAINRVEKARVDADKQIEHLDEAVKKYMQ